MFLCTHSLSDNNIGENGAKAIAEALKVNTTVTSISLYGNNIDESDEREIDKLVRFNEWTREVITSDVPRIIERYFIVASAFLSKLSLEQPVLDIMASDIMASALTMNVLKDAAETRDDAVYYSEFSEYEQCRACSLVFKALEEGFLRKIHENRYESNKLRETKRAKNS